MDGKTAATLNYLLLWKFVSLQLCRSSHGFHWRKIEDSEREKKTHHNNSWVIIDNNMTIKTPMQSNMDQLNSEIILPCRLSSLKFFFVVVCLQDRLLNAPIYFLLLHKVCMQHSCVGRMLRHASHNFFLFYYFYYYYSTIKTNIGFTA